MDAHAAVQDAAVQDAAHARPYLALQLRSLFSVLSVQSFGELVVQSGGRLLLTGLSVFSLGGGVRASHSRAAAPTALS